MEELKKLEKDNDSKDHNLKTLTQSISDKEKEITSHKEMIKSLNQEVKQLKFDVNNQQ